MPRFFVSPEAICDGQITIAGDDARHIARSLRMAVGDEVTLSDGLGNEYSCRLTKIRDEECTAEVLSSEKSTREPTHPVTLYMAYPKGDKLETVVQKSVELGASHIVPFESERCIKRPAPEKAEKQTARLQRIADEAAKQCGRAKIPTCWCRWCCGSAGSDGAAMMTAAPLRCIFRQKIGGGGRYNTKRGGKTYRIPRGERSGMCGQGYIPSCDRGGFPRSEFI